MKENDVDGLKETRACGPPEMGRMTFLNLHFLLEQDRQSVADECGWRHWGAHIGMDLSAQLSKCSGKSV